MNWLLAEPLASSASEPFADLLIRCRHERETLPELLTVLSARRLLPIYVDSHRNVGAAFIELRLPLCDPARAERLARLLSFGTGVRSVSFRVRCGASGILAAPARRAKPHDRGDRGTRGKAA